MITDDAKNNIELLASAINLNKLAAIECTEKATGASVVVLVVAVPDQEKGGTKMFPIGRLFNSDSEAFDELESPAGTSIQTMAKGARMQDPDLMKVMEDADVEIIVDPSLTDSELMGEDDDDDETPPTVH